MKTEQDPKFVPIVVTIETRFEYESLLLAMRIGADAMRKLEKKDFPILAPNKVEQMREQLMAVRASDREEADRQFGQPHHGHVRETER